MVQPVAHGRKPGDFAVKGADNLLVVGTFIAQNLSCFGNFDDSGPGAVFG